jgi:hypothetical protein
MVDRDEAGDENDEPLSLELIAPAKPKKKKAEEKKQPVGVGAQESGSDEPSEEPGDEGGESGDGE